MFVESAVRLKDSHQTTSSSSWLPAASTWGLLRQSLQGHVPRLLREKERYDAAARQARKTLTDSIHTEMSKRRCV